MLQEKKIFFYSGQKKKKIDDRWHLPLKRQINAEEGGGNESQ